MRTLLRILVVTSAAVLAAGMVQSAGSAAPVKTVFTVYHVDGAGTSFHNYEFRWLCANVGPCDKFGGHVVFQIVVSDRPQPVAPITISYAIDDVTAIHDANYFGPTSGTLTIGSSANDVQLAIPIIDSRSVDAPDKTLRVRLTASSVLGADISDTEIGLIHSGGPMPRDCTPSLPDSQSFSTTCTARGSSQWRVYVTCMIYFPRLVTRYGLTVTGNGTSSATCTGSGGAFEEWKFQLVA